METIERIREAHIKSGAPGHVTGYFADGRYTVELRYGSMTFRFRTHGVSDPRVTVLPCWFIDGHRQRRQATA